MSLIDWLWIVGVRIWMCVLIFDDCYMLMWWMWDECVCDVFEVVCDEVCVCEGCEIICGMCVGVVCGVWCVWGCDVNGNDVVGCWWCVRVRWGVVWEWVSVVCVCGDCVVWVWFEWCVVEFEWWYVVVWKVGMVLEVWFEGRVEFRVFGFERLFECWFEC